MACCLCVSKGPIAEITEMLFCLCRCWVDLDYAWSCKNNCCLQNVHLFCSCGENTPAVIPCGCRNETVLDVAICDFVAFVFSVIEKCYWGIWVFKSFKW